MPTVGSEGTWNREFLIWLAENELCLENIVVKAGSGVLPSGRMLGKITVGGKYDNFDTGASDGTEVCAGILLDNCDASGADDIGAVLVARVAVVKDSQVTAETTGHKAAGKTTLAASLVIFR